MHAVLLLFPITDKSEALSASEAAVIEQNGQTLSEKVYYMRQTIGNACGTIGVLHAVGARDYFPYRLPRASNVDAERLSPPRPCSFCLSLTHRTSGVTLDGDAFFI